jgi:Tfp pilus assembly protein FimT
MEKRAEKGRIWTLKGKRAGGIEGFTLLELTVVLLLLGFLLLMTLPNFREFIGPGDIRKAVLGFVGTLRYAQSQAAMTKQRHRLNMDFSENTFWVTRQGDDGQFSQDPSSPREPRSLPKGVVFMDVSLEERGKIQGGKAFIEFSPTGWVEECTLHLRKAEEEIFTVFVHPLGGKMEVIPGYLERGKG